MHLNSSESFPPADFNVIGIDPLVSAIRYLVSALVHSVCPEVIKIQLFVS
jgi:hypothetical protein